MDRRQLQALAERWRTLAHQVSVDMKGQPGKFGKFKPHGTVKAKMGTQVSVLLSCAASLEALLDE